MNYDSETVKNLFNCIDLTSLNTDDSHKKIENLCNKVKDFRNHFPDVQNVAAVCTFPAYALQLKDLLRKTEVKRAVVSASFPHSQTFFVSKIEETKNALEYGANEIDIVIDIGEFLDGNYNEVGSTIYLIKNTMTEIDNESKLKVILETGILSSPENIWKSSLLSLVAGADFIKSSTGKHSISATPEAVWVMAHAIKAFQEKNGKQAGIKPSGGIVTIEDAMIYWAIVKKVLGSNYLNNNYFRIGASRLANNLLTELEKLKGTKKIVNYF